MLDICWRTGIITKVWVEVDAIVILYTVQQKQYLGHWQMQHNFSELQRLQNNMDSRYTHIYREGKQNCLFFG